MTVPHSTFAPELGPAFPPGSWAQYVADVATDIGVTPPLVCEQTDLLATHGDFTARQARLLGLLECTLLAVARGHGLCSPAGCDTCRPVRRGVAALVADAVVAHTGGVEVAA